MIRKEGRAPEPTRMESLIVRTGILAGITLALSLAFMGTAAAHPHVWITVRAGVEFDRDGRIAAVVDDWVFDEMY